MNRTASPSILLFALFCSGATAAADTGAIRCQSAESYVYLYQSPTNFQVIANLHCSDKVEVLDAPASAMVRVRTADGKEGYVQRASVSAITPGNAAQPEPPANQQSPATQAAPAVSAPLADSELMALVAGNSLTENILRAIAARGLAFRPDDQYRAWLQSAGADAKLMAALANARIAGQNSSSNRAPLLQHLGAAGNLIRSNKFDQASQELSAALQSGAGYEAGFVMGEVLCQQKQWPEASAVYEEVLRRAPGFIEARTKWSYVLYNAGDEEEALRQAKLVLALDPENAEAHKNAGLALQVLQKFEASENEYNEALRIKPDYAAVRYNLGILFYKQSKWDQSIAEYKKALALDPDQSDWHYNLALAYESKGDLESAIRENREAKRLDPKRLDARMNLANVLMRDGLNVEAVAEMRELQAMAPDSAVCHRCLAIALFRSWRLDDAAQEYRKAIELDPSDAASHRGLGAVKETQKDYDGALAEYRAAENLDPADRLTRMDMGRLLVEKKDAAGALEELKRAELLDPGSAETHDLYAQALELSGDHVGAVGEYKQSLALDPNQPEVRLRFAAALEITQKWVDALDQYRQVAVHDERPQTQAIYKAAKQRLEARIAAMKSAGNSAGAAMVKSDLQAAQTNPNLSQKLDIAMQDGLEASQGGRFDEAENLYKEAVDLADKIQPHDDRLATSLMHLAGLYIGRKNFTLADATFQRYLKVNEELFGPESPMLNLPLQVMGNYELGKKDYAAALSYFQRAIDLTQKTFGETSQMMATNLSLASNVFTEQKQYDKAEAYLLRALHINQSLGDQAGFSANLTLGYLCMLYDKWGKPEKAEPCYRQAVDVMAKQFGPDHPAMLPVLAKHAEALRALGRLDEAKQVEQRVASIRAATGASASFDPTGPPPAGLPGAPPNR